MTDQEPLPNERVADRVRRGGSAALAVLRGVPERMRGVRTQARRHARRGSDWAASWLSLLEGGVDLVIVLLAVVAVADACAPRVDLPWTPVTLNDPVGPLTKSKLRATVGPAAAPDQCRAFLQGEGVAFTPSPIASDNPGCVVPDAIALGPEARLSPVGSPMDCGLATAYLLWSRQVVEPAARRYFAADVDHVQTLGIHQCRTIARTTRPSEHMQAKAMDVGGVVLSDGQSITVARDWSDPGPKGQFLHAIRDGACRTFSGGALSPDYNADHHDHLHLDVGGYSICG